ncbi:hypothetical protein Bca101_089854 [Brassica carinata]
MKGFRSLTSTSFLTLFILFLFGYNSEVASTVPTRHLCRPEQRNALLQLKNEFEVLNSSLTYNCIINDEIVDPHPKTESWGNYSDCCTWEGITCNAKSGEVIELNLGCSNLRGQFHSNSSLQNLHSLTTLVLSGNLFNGQIMSSIGNISHLTSLDLSQNNFSEFNPSSIVDLSYLTFLDLSRNRFSGQIPSSIRNLSPLTYLDISGNQISGQIPSWIGNLYKLTHLDLSLNNLVGEIPPSIGNLNQLTTLSVYRNKLNGSLPNALLNLTELSNLELNFNHFTGTFLPNVTSLSKLTHLEAATNMFTGTLPSSLFTLPSIDTVILSDNQFNGILELGNISLPSKLRVLDVGNNNLRGPIPATLSKFTNLDRLVLSYYKTQGPVDFSIFSHLKKMEDLDISYLNTTTTIELNDFLSHFKRLRWVVLSGNHVSVTDKSPVSDPPLRLMYKLYLSGCGITEFPKFATAENMSSLDISKNKIKGKVPGWLWTTLPNLDYLNLSNNSFTGFENSTKHGLSMTNFLASNNNFSGNIPSFICDWRGLATLDLSNNNFNGSIPRCMGNLKSSLLDLNLRQNRLNGGLPENIYESLRTLDIGHNQLTGKLQRSLIRFSSLEVLNVESNIINDVFPSWLSSLPELRVLLLSSNAFHGPIPQTSFPKLQIIDISHNHFNGALPSDYFVKWSAMSSLVTDYDLDQKYMRDFYYYNSIVLMNKGFELELQRISQVFAALDFSGNKFEGEIPRSIGLLKELHVLNLSNNAFTGHIPSSLGNLTALESLDVSQNQLSGEIPQELGELSFLSYMNFSHNQLAGLVPGGTQFRRLNCSSFEDNMGLFGPSLDEICRDIHTSTVTQQYEMPESEDVEEMLSWTAALIGVLPGIAFGWVIGYILVPYKPEWFMKLFFLRRRRHHNSLKRFFVTYVKNLKEEI